MAGVKQFDAEAVLDRAMEVFWRKGYEATSVQDLELATGLGRGSLYNAFKDKETLFLEVLGRYGGQYAVPPLRHLADPDAARGLRSVLDAQVARMEDPDSPRGCMTVNTSLIDGQSVVISARVTNAVKAMQAAFGGAFDRAKAAGQLSPEADTVKLARFYSSVMLSTAVLHKAHSDRRTLEDVVEVAMQAWPGT